MATASAGTAGGKIHASILESITNLGEKRVRQYFERNYIDINNRVERSENEETGVSLTKMTSTVKQLENEKKVRILKATATKKTDIKSNMKIDDIIQEYNKLRTESESSGVKLDELPARSKMNHDTYAEKLAAARKKIFKKNALMKDSIIDEIEEEYKQKELSREDDRVSILKHNLFTFPQSVRNQERYNKKINLLHVPIANT